MFPEEEDVRVVRDAMFDPFEYLMARRRDGLLKTDFKRRSARSPITCRAIARAEDRAEDAGGAGERCPGPRC